MPVKFLSALLFLPVGQVRLLRWRQVIATLLFLGMATSSFPSVAASICYGKPGKGRLAHGVQLPAGGRNFSVYSRVGHAMGRTYVHDRVAATVLAAYAALEQTAPDKVFVYGETGKENGGPIKPHRTHQNGLSVDFMVPMLDKAGRSVPLPASPSNKFGYGIDFDNEGKSGALTIDFEAMAEHLYQLALAAQQQKISIALTIFDPPLMPRLLATRRGPYLKQHLAFMKKGAWVRHDEHYHVDFALPCQPL